MVFCKLSIGRDMFLGEITPSLKNTTDERLFEAGKL